MFGNRKSKPKFQNDKLKRYPSSLLSSSRQSSASKKGKDTKEKVLTTYQSLIEDAFPNVKYFPKELQPLVLDYLHGDIDDKTSTPKQRESFRLFSRNIQTLQAPRQAEEAAKQILLSNADKVLELVEKNPEILFCRIPEVTDPRPRRIFKDQRIVLLRNKTLLQVAGAAGEFNYKEMQADEKDYGIVERLSRFLPRKEVLNQLSAQFPPGWKEETARRMEAYSIALTIFAEAFINIQVPRDPIAIKEGTLIINNYWTSIETAANREVTTGLIISPQVFRDAIRFFYDNDDRFGGWHHHKSNLYFVIGYGSLQQLAIGDAPIIQSGIYRILECDEMPNRSISTTCPALALGIDFFVDDIGRRIDKAFMAFILGFFRWLPAFEKLISNKDISASKLMLQSDGQVLGDTKLPAKSAQKISSYLDKPKGQGLTSVLRKSCNHVQEEKNRSKKISVCKNKR